jgi:hypothetical protein
MARKQTGIPAFVLGFRLLRSPDGRLLLARSLEFSFGRNVRNGWKAAIGMIRFRPCRWFSEPLVA